MSDPETRANPGLVWQVSALCRAIADLVDARLNPVEVRGEISGFSRAGSGHCYFNLKDEAGQIRCAMFRRASSLLDFNPSDGELVQVRGKLGVYQPRGDLQLIVESMQRAGQGALFEQFVKLKARLEAEGLFEQSRKRALPTMPRGIGLVTSLSAAALHDVVTTLARRVPHIPVIVSPATVQGASAPQELIGALDRLYQLATDSKARVPVDLILLVRGGGSLEDLWAFNDESLARTVARSPVPVVCGVGHETDFTISDFVADVRAPTPTAAAELAAVARSERLAEIELLWGLLQAALSKHIDTLGQRLDLAVNRLGRPSEQIGRLRLVLARQMQQLRLAASSAAQQRRRAAEGLAATWPDKWGREFERNRQRLDRAALRLQLLDPALVLQRGYAWVNDTGGRVVKNAADLVHGQALRVHLAQGEIDVKVSSGKEKGR